MSYIVPREKPKCYNCPFRTLDYCGLLIEHDRVTVNVNEMTVSEYCPLVEIPTPHGRLIDSDALMTEFMDSDLDYLQRDDWKEIIQIVSDADVVIESEGREE